MVKTIWAFFLPMPQLSQRLYLAQFGEKMTLNPAVTPWPKQKPLPRLQIWWWQQSMIDLILAFSCGVMFYSGFKCGAVYNTFPKMFNDLKTKLKNI